MTADRRPADPGLIFGLKGIFHFPSGRFTTLGTLAGASAMGELQCSDWVDYSCPISFDLSQTKLGKTLDIGNNGTSASADHLGRVRSFSAPIIILNSSVLTTVTDSPAQHVPGRPRHHQRRSLRTVRQGPLP